MYANELLAFAEAPEASQAVAHSGREIVTTQCHSHNRRGVPACGGYDDCDCDIERHFLVRGAPLPGRGPSIGCVLNLKSLFCRGP